jgi:hypothetical protein
MTTVAYRAGVLAADTRGTINGWITPAADRKVFKLADGRLLGFTGSFERAYPFKEWLEGGGKGDKPDLSDSRAIVIQKRGPRLIYEGAGWYEEESPFGAWGSGMPAALAALHMGASAIEAVKIAMLVDNNSGGRVISVSLRD